MRIAFVGAQGTGKTTLINKLHEAKPSSKVYKEVVRELIKTRGIKINRDGDNYSQDLISVTHLNNALESYYCGEKSLWYLYDRCIIDSHAYGMTCSAVNSKSLDFSRNMIDTIFRNYKYDLLVYVPPYNDFLKEDGVRDTDSNYQTVVDKNMMNLLECVKEDHNIDILHIKEIGIEKRVNEIITYIKEK